MSKTRTEWPELMAAHAAHASHPALADFYRAFDIAPDTPLSEIPLVALDIETTGLDPTRDAIVSIGLVNCSSQRVRCAEHWYQVVRPRHLSIDSIPLHRITHAEVRHAPPLTDVLPMLLQHLQGKVALVHYHPIEREFLAHAVKQLLGQALYFPLIDTMQLEARQHPRQSRSWLDRLRGKGPASLRLADCRSRYHLPAYQPHHALTDAIASAELLQAQCSRHVDAGRAVKEFWS
ncbi:3'-5' exonuclease [Halopseudomonas salegens]|uniref:DNA polymerase-3 subunit epsilon n=1 Tax=Halopseudomonas salegens TaxID=1434072 RepID=A0A1H2H3P9_9GAMM|nr:3'-5' exonuclease [Halopseudomonas salegens]SDU26517.1 DNA polymerase-3 subunit epsilon [Halopseudomonas salegens]